MVCLALLGGASFALEGHHVVMTTGKKRLPRVNDEVDPKGSGRRPDLESEHPAREHVLLTVLGLAPRPARYVLGGREAEARLAPVALLDLLPPADRPGRVVAFCTPEATEQSWPYLEAALRDRCQVQRIDVPGGMSQDGVDTYLARVSNAIPESRDVDLTVDVTHGPRHFSFLTYIAVLYLAALRDVRVHGAYYSLPRENAPSPFLDLRPLLDLPRWIHALQVARETGSTLPLAEAIDPGSRGRTATARRAKDIARDLYAMSEAYLSGLPLELGRLAHDVHARRLGALKKLLVGDHRLPLAGELIEGLKGTLGSFAADTPTVGDGWKQRVDLTAVELDRQARIIDDLLRRKNVAAALGLMSEWTVSWVVWRQGGRSEWLDYANTRRRAGRLLGAMAAVGGDSELRSRLTAEQRSLGGFWARLSELRNAYHHHGMRPLPLVRDRNAEKTMRRVQDFWNDTLRSRPDIFLSLGESPGGRVLVSPIGKRPGVLFSAVHACRTDGGGGEPVLCLAVCSGASQGMVAEALQRACYAGAVEPLVFDDAVGGGRSEIEHLVQAARPHFVGAGDVVVNVTGGTTLMGLAAEALATAARDLACPVRRFGLIDRRPPSEQESEPYRAGEPFWLDTAENNDAGDSD